MKDWWSMVLQNVIFIKHMKIRRLKDILEHVKWKLQDKLEAKEYPTSISRSNYHGPEVGFDDLESTENSDYSDMENHHRIEEEETESDEGVESNLTKAYVRSYEI
ncbi:hypothetical protein LXL04_034441 [Taraxacum kok-saghyz]